MASLYTSMGALTRLSARSSTLTGARTLRSLVFQKRSFMALHNTHFRSQLIPGSFFSQLRYSSATAAATKPAQSTPAEKAPISFDTLADTLSPKTLKALTETMGLKNLSIVQESILPMLPELAEPYSPELENADDAGPRDLLVKSKTGTGKTLAFLVPAVEARVKAYEKAVRDAGITDLRSNEARDVLRKFGKSTVGALIISPTRELAMQIAKEASTLTSHHRMGVKVFVGGENKGAQLRNWNYGSQDIVVATPGRLMDVLENSNGMDAIRNTQTFILDEADTLLDMGFRDDIERIKTYLPPTPQRQTFMFSATVSRAIQQIAQSTLNPSHAFINCVPADSSPVHAHIPQHYTVLPSAEHQLPHVMRLIAHDQLLNPGSSKVMVFLPTTKMTQLFSDVLGSLSAHCFPVNRTNVFTIHSRKDQKQRARVSDLFRNTRSAGSVLVTSDVSARGVDYPGVTRVIQVGASKDTDQYIHRVGRTGRAGTSGRGDIVLLPWEMKFATSALSKVPLKPVTVAELETQVRELTAEVESDPKEFLRSSEGRSPSISHFNLPYEPKIEKISSLIERALQTVDPESPNETFGSMLGYYTQLSELLRLEKMAIVDGLKEWAVKGLKMEQEPHVSASMLQKLGISTRAGPRRDSSFGASRSFGSRGGYGGGRDNNSNRAPWMGRGSMGSSSSRGSGSQPWEGRGSFGGRDRNNNYNRDGGNRRSGGDRRSGGGNFRDEGFSF